MTKRSFKLNPQQVELLSKVQAAFKLSPAVVQLNAVITAFVASHGEQPAAWFPSEDSTELITLMEDAPASAAPLAFPGKLQEMKPVAPQGEVV